MINWIAYYNQNDGYGRLSSRLVEELQSVTDCQAFTQDHITMPRWMQRQAGLNWDNLTISCLPGILVQAVPGQHWLYTMTESSLLPDGWAERINASGVERVIVPCESNALAMRESGVLAPVTVVPGGVDPDEFPIWMHDRPLNMPYTFLTLADRGFRKGWEEVWQAFYIAFGGKTGGDKDVRLIIKAMPSKLPTTLDWMMNAEGRDERIEFQVYDAPHPYSVYLQADCVALPSRYEGFGMPHREAASIGLPVITQVYAGLDDGFTSCWSLPVQHGTIRPVPKELAPQRGEWRIVNKEALAEMMFWCYRNREEAKRKGHQAALWLHENQTWAHSVKRLLELDDAIRVECSALPVQEPVS